MSRSVSLCSTARGLTDVSASEVALVQDEKGVIFVYDLRKRSVAQEIRFGPSGDYEGLTRCINSRGTRVTQWPVTRATAQPRTRIPTASAGIR